MSYKTAEKKSTIDSMKRKEDSSGGLPGQSMTKRRAQSLGFRMGKKPVSMNVPATTNKGDHPFPHWNLESYPETCVGIFENLMKTVGVGAVPLHEHEEDWIGNFMLQLHNKLSQNAVLSPLLPEGNIRLMKKVMEGCEQLVEQQRRLAAVIKIQSLVRGRLTRNRLKIWLAHDNVTMKNIKNSRLFKCATAFADLMTEETSYTRALEIIVHNYLLPLKKSNEEKRKSILPSFLQQVQISKEDIQNMFGNVELLLKVHTKNRKRFQKIREKWPFMNVGETFLFMAPELIVYGDYVTNCTNAINTLLRLQQEDPKFNDFLENTVQQCGQPLVGLLVRPLNHISQYMMFLKNMIKNSPSNNTDLANLHNAYLAIKRTYKFIQDSHSQSSNKAKMVDVQRRLTITGFELMDPKRMYISEGLVGSYEKTLGFNTEKQRKYFLFSDVFLLAEEVTKDKFKSLILATLKDSTIEENPKQKQYTISCGPTTKIILGMDEKGELLKKIKEMIQQTNTAGRVFGVPLDKLLEREKPNDGIPYVVKCTTNFLKLRKQTEGLFRISGGSEEVANLKAQFNKVEDPAKQNINLNTFSPHSVAAILKMFFRELPEPLLTFEAYKPLITIPKLDVETMKPIVNKIPKQNQVLLKYLASFLGSIASYESQNKMGFSNLATVFGPNLVYPREETLENILAIPKLNSTIQFIFAHYTEILP